jgi:membrane protein
VLGQTRVRHDVVAQVSELVGEQAGQLADTVIQKASQPGKTQTATLIGVAGLLLGASGTFTQLKTALNRIWEVKPRPGLGIGTFLRTRVISFGLVVGVGVLFLVMLAASTYVSALVEWATTILPGWIPVLRGANLLVTFLVVTVLFGVILRFLPDAKIECKEVRFGAVVTGALFTIGQYLIGLYFARASPASVYGAAGSLAIMLLWIYYSSLIFLFGAEITRAHAMRLGKPVIPKPEAEPCPGAGERGPGSRPPGSPDAD